MNPDKEFASHVIDLLDSFGPCEARRMFGGYGIFHQGRMFGLIADGCLYLKADAQSRALFVDQGSHPFTYRKKDRELELSYYLAAEAFFEDSEETLRWAGIAFDAALRNPTKKRKRKT